MVPECTIILYCIPCDNVVRPSGQILLACQTTYLGIEGSALMLFEDGGNVGTLLHVLPLKVVRAWVGSPGLHLRFMYMSYAELAGWL